METKPQADALEPSALQQLLTTHTFGRVLQVWPSATSTNDLVKTLAQDGAPEGTVVIADHQTNGRGRQGRTFASPAGVGIYLSLLLRPQIDMARLPQLTLVSAVATAQALTAYSALPVQLKWPNDVEVYGKKVAGILCEAAVSPSTATLAIIGIGINVNTALEDFPLELQPFVTSLALAAGHSWSRAPLIALLLAHLERLYTLFQQGHMATILAQWLHYGPIVGRRVRFTQDTRALTGIVAGLDEDGALRVHDPAGTLYRLVAGEVVFL